MRQSALITLTLWSLNNYFATDIICADLQKTFVDLLVKKLKNLVQLFNILFLIKRSIVLISIVLQGVGYSANI